MSDEDDTLSEQQDGNIQIQPKEIPDEDDMPSEVQEGVERIPPQYQILYTQIYLFKKTVDIVLLNKRKYKASISLGLMANKMHPVSSVFDTSA